MGDFVGRQAIRATLGEEFACASAGTPRLVLLEGPSGIGKSAIIQSFLNSLHGTPHTVLRARADESERFLTFGIIEQLAQGAQRAGSDTLAVSLTREPVIDPRPAIHSPLDLGVDLLQTISEFQENGPVVLVIEDAQWIDDMSSQTVLFMLRRLARDAVITVVTSQSDESVLVDRGWSRILTEGTGTRIVVTGLDVHELAELSVKICGAPLSPMGANRLWEHTEGHPLYASSLLEEMGTEAFENPGSNLFAPRSLKTIITRRLENFTENTRRFLEAASVLGLRFHLDDALRLAGFVFNTGTTLPDPGDDIPSIDDPDLAPFLENVPGAGGQVRFRHVLMRAAMYESLDIRWRCELHLKAAEILGGDAPLIHRSLSVLGTDDALASDLENRALTYLVQGAKDQAAPLLISAGKLSSVREDRDRRFVLGTMTFLNSGNFRAGISLQPFIEEAASAPWRNLALGTIEAFRGKIGRATEILTDAWMSTHDKPEFALIASLAADGLGLIAISGPRAHDAMRWGKLARASASGDVHLELAACAIEAFGFGANGETMRGLALIDERTADPRVNDADTALLRLERCILKIWQSELRSGRKDLSDLAATTDPSNRFLIFVSLAEVEYRLGNLEEALNRAELTRAIAFEIGSVPNIVQACSMAAICNATKGNYAAAERDIEVINQLIPEFDGSYYSHMKANALFVLARARSDADGMLGAVTNIVDAPLPAETGRSLLGPIESEAMLALGRLDTADAALKPYEHLAVATGSAWGKILAGHMRGRIAAQRGDTNLASTAFESALDEAFHLGARLEEGRIAFSFGQALLGFGRRDEGLRKFEAAAAIFRSIGAGAYLDLLESIRHEHSPIDNDTNGESAGRQSANEQKSEKGSALAERSTDGRYIPKLTQQELVVAGLVVQGLSNKLIAADLYLSVKTIEYHLGNIYSKLGITSRTQLAAKYGNALSDL